MSHVAGLFISRFGFKSGICLLIAAVPVHCFSITFICLAISSCIKYYNQRNITVVRPFWSEQYF